MFRSTLPRLRCPRFKKAAQGKVVPCGGPLSVSSPEKGSEIRTGQLECQKCRSKFPILCGVAILVDDVQAYLMTHVKGISKLVNDSEIPREYVSEFQEAREEIEAEHIEEDLEAERVISLYFMNHYLRVSGGGPSSSSGRKWWQPEDGEGSPLIDSLVRQYWDHGPFSWIEKWATESSRSARLDSVIELGCGVGGLEKVLRPFARSYLGIDSSFGSIALGRHLAFGASYPAKIRVPGDLLLGSVARPVAPEWMEQVSGARSGNSEEQAGSSDLIVGEIQNAPVQPGQCDATIALNAIDMLDEPSELPALQMSLLRKGGIAIQSCPYIWHETVSKQLRKILPRETRNSARAVEWLYRQAGFEIESVIEHLPWLFFKHPRQLEIYSVHLFTARKETETGKPSLSPKSR